MNVIHTHVNSNVKENIDSFHDLKKCVHYCSVGGHLWTCNSLRDKNGISECHWRISDKELGSVIKFFSVCKDHRRQT